MNDWDYSYIKKDTFPMGFEHSYADTMAGVIRTGLAIVGVVALIFAIGFLSGYFWGVRRKQYFN
jgi:hypothetical protein